MRKASVCAFVMLFSLCISFLMAGTSTVGSKMRSQQISSASNVLVNGDFETGDFSGWSVGGVCSISSTVVHSGSYSAYVSDETYDNWITQNIVELADRDWHFEAWVYPLKVGNLGDAYSAASYIKLRFYNASSMLFAFNVDYCWCWNSATVNDNGSDNVKFLLPFTSSTWNLLSRNVTRDVCSYFVGINLSEYMLYNITAFYHYSNGDPGVFYLDDVSLFTPTRTWIVDASGSGDFTTIQAAINAASIGDTIFVRNGTYYENIVLNKTVTLSGENKATTIVDANQSGDCVYVVAPSVTVESLTLRNGGSKPFTAYSCVNLSSNGDNVIDNILIGSWCGVSLADNCSYEVVANNSISSNLNGVSGELLSHIRITGNDIDNNLDGIWLGPYSSFCDISFNNLSDSWTEGLSAYAPSYCVFEGNNIKSNNQAGWGEGLTLAFQQPFSYGNKFFHNNIKNNGKEINLQMGTPDQISFDDGYTSGGNYWDNYNGTDFFGGPYQNITGSNGIGDTPYIIDSSNTDNYPLMKPYPWSSHDVGVTFIGEVEYPIYVVQKTFIWNSSMLRFDAFIMNYGDSIESTNVTAFANGTIIDHVYNVTIASHNSTILDMRWNTTGFLLGYYNITVYAEPVIGESDLADNARSTWMHVYIFGDINGDGKVDIRDIALLAKAFGQTVPPANPDLDVNQDWKIDIRDIAAVAKHFGEAYP